MIETLVAVVSELDKESVLSKTTETLNSVNEIAEMKINEAPVENRIDTIENCSIESIESNNEFSIEQKFIEESPTRPLYENKPNLLNWMNKFETTLKDVPGFIECKMKTLSYNIDSARGSFAELARAFRLKEAGIDVKEIGKKVETNLGKTDIDILVKNIKGENIWIENKDVKNISLTNESKLKIDKMADGIKSGVKDTSGEIVKIDKAIFVNNKNISENLSNYAKSQGIHIKENMNAKIFPKYFNNIN